MSYRTEDDGDRLVVRFTLEDPTTLEPYETCLSFTQTGLDSVQNNRLQLRELETWLVYIQNWLRPHVLKSATCVSSNNFNLFTWCTEYAYGRPVYCNDEILSASLSAFVLGLRSGRKDNV